MYNGRKKNKGFKNDFIDFFDRLDNLQSQQEKPNVREHNQIAQQKITPMNLKNTHIQNFKSKPPVNINAEAKNPSSGNIDLDYLNFKQNKNDNNHQKVRETKNHVSRMNVAKKTSKLEDCLPPNVRAKADFKKGLNLDQNYPKRFDIQNYEQEKLNILCMLLEQETSILEVNEIFYPTIEYVDTFIGLKIDEDSQKDSKASKSLKNSYEFKESFNNNPKNNRKRCHSFSGNFGEELYDEKNFEANNEMISEADDPNFYQSCQNFIVEEYTRAPKQYESKNLYNQNMQAYNQRMQPPNQNLKPQNQNKQPHNQNVKPYNKIDKNPFQNQHMNYQQNLVQDGYDIRYNMNQFNDDLEEGSYINNHVTNDVERKKPTKVQKKAKLLKAFNSFLEDF